MACHNSCCPTPFRYRRTVVVATNSCNPCGFGGVLGPYGAVGPLGVNAGLGLGLGWGVNAAAGCGYPGFGWGVSVAPYGPF